MRPVAYQWTGDAMAVVPRFAKLADEQFVIGEHYVLVPHEERSMASHGHYFVLVNEAWRNLPESYGDRWPTADHLRKWALIKAGFRDERSFACSSKAEARRMAAFLKPMDDYAVVIVSEALVIVYTAKSQKLTHMGKAVFQASKDAVLEILAELLEVTPEALTKHTEAA